MATTIRIAATSALGYVFFVGYSLFASSGRGGPSSSGFFVAAVVGWLLAFFGGDIAEFFICRPVDTLIRSLGVLLLLILAFVAFTQQHV
jgi:hypothetical protein